MRRVQLPPSMTTVSPASFFILLEGDHRSSIAEGDIMSLLQDGEPEHSREKDRCNNMSSRDERDGLILYAGGRYPTILPNRLLLAFTFTSAYIHRHIPTSLQF